MIYVYIYIHTHYYNMLYIYTLIILQTKSCKRSVLLHRCFSMAGVWIFGSTGVRRDKKPNDFAKRFSDDLTTKWIPKTVMVEQMLHIY